MAKAILLLWKSQTWKMKDVWWVTVMYMGTEGSEYYGDNRKPCGALTSVFIYRKTIVSGTRTVPETVDTHIMFICFQYIDVKQIREFSTRDNFCNFQTNKYICGIAIYTREALWKVQLLQYNNVYNRHYALHIKRPAVCEAQYFMTPSIHYLSNQPSEEHQLSSYC